MFFSKVALRGGMLWLTHVLLLVSVAKIDGNILDSCQEASDASDELTKKFSVAAKAYVSEYLEKVQSCDSFPSGETSASSGTSTSSPITFKFTSDYEEIWNDAGSGAHSDVSFWRPMSSSFDYFALGDVVTPSHSKPKRSAMIVKALETRALKPPTGFKEIWKDRGSGASRDVRILRMNAPTGYTCLGDVAIEGYSNLPDLNKYRCVKTAYVTTGRLSVVWRDSGSGADVDFSAWVVGRGQDVNSQDPGTFLSRASHGMPTETAHLLNSRFAKNHLDVNFDHLNVRLKLYQMKDLELIWKDTGSGGNYDFSCWRVHGSAGGYRLTDIPQDSYNKPRFGFVAKATDPDDLQAPYDYRKIWGDHGSGANWDGAFWEPICPGGYVALGYLCTRGYSKPCVNETRCVNSKLVARGDWQWVWIDRGSGAHTDCAIYRAIPGDPGQQQVFGMGVVARYGCMPSRAYVLKGDLTTVIEAKPAKKYILTNVHYKIDNSKIVRSEVVTLARLVIENRGSTEQTATRTLKGSWTETRSWSHFSGIETGVSVIVEAEVPLVAKTSVTMGAKSSFSYTTGGSKSEAKTDSVSATGAVKPHSQKTITLVGTNYLVDIPYTADIKTEYEDGTIGYRKQVAGVYKGVNVAEVRVLYEADVPL